ncbi:MAG: hypothetical protein KC502_01510 [Myxococcales bacterium]|nr:hypothetical protein [Myxococcales bacterium]
MKGARLLSLVHVLLVLSLALLTACSGAVVPRPTTGPCAKPDVSHWASLASQSLRVERFIARPLYDLNGKGGATSLPTVRCDDCMAVISYPMPLRHAGGPKGFDRLKKRSFTYDNALVALVRLAEGRPQQARQILSTLAALQRPDGAWGFSFNVSGDGFYNAGYVRTGVVAWVLYAMARYTEIKGDRRFIPSMRRASQWMKGRIDRKNALVRGGFGRWLNGGATYEPTHVASWASTEHNVDAWFAVRLAAHVDPSGSYINPAALGRSIAKRLWLPKEGRYARGINGDTPDTVIALDAAGTWSALQALAAMQIPRAQRAIAFVDAELGFEEGGWHAHRPDNEVPKRLWFVEASVARSMVLNRLGRKAEARKGMSQLASWACVRGVPLAYSSHWHQDFPLTPAAAPTAWFVLAAHEVWQRKAPFLWRQTLP